jgi:hypothetical protein
MKNNNWYFDNEPIQNTDGAFVEWHNHKFFDLVFQGKIFHGEIQEEKSVGPSKVKPQVDWEYHCIRRAIYLQYAIFSIFEKNKDNNNFCRSQLKTVLDKISKLNVNPLLPPDFYNYMNSFNGKNPGDPESEMKVIPLCNMSRKPIYNTYMHKIKKHIEKNITDYKKDNLSLSKQSPIEAVLQWYVIELFTHKQCCSTEGKNNHQICLLLL